MGFEELLLSHRRWVYFVGTLVLSFFFAHEWIDNYEETTTTTVGMTSTKTSAGGATSLLRTTTNSSSSATLASSDVMTIAPIVSNNKRKNASETLEWILSHHGNDTEIDAIIPEISQTFPRPASEEGNHNLNESAIHIYNVTAWHQLRQILTARKSFTICANGGSVTAGSHGRGGRYFVDFVRYLKGGQHELPSSGYRHNGPADQTLTFTDGSKVTVLDRAHGARGSLHSALLTHYYFPPNNSIDVLIWEFSVNDDSWITDYDARQAGERKAFETWLDAIGKLPGKPPLVIVVYLWSSPFQFLEESNDETNNIVDHVYESHQQIGAKYDFVVGHIRVGQYLARDLKWPEATTKQLLLGDQHHLNRLGHALTGFLLWDFVQLDESRLKRASQDAPALLQRVHNQLSPGHWTCNHAHSDAERRITQLMESSGRSIASWTMDYPHNSLLRQNDNNYYPGMLQIKQEQQSGTSATAASKLLGKQSEWRVDRQGTKVLPCCSSSGNASSSVFLEFVLPSNIPIGEENSGVTAIHLGLPRRTNGKDGVRVYLDDRDVSAHQTHIYGKWSRAHGGATPGWDCLGWTLSTVYAPWFWVLLPQMQRNISSIKLCSDDTLTCGDEETGSLIQTLAVF